MPSGGTRRTSHNFGQRMAPVVRARVVAEYDHDHKAFTQGLIWCDGHLYESTGLQGASTIRKVELASGKVVEYHELHQKEFGEGLALVGPHNSRLLQVLWKAGRGYVYDRSNLLPLFQFSYDGDAWGLASLPEDRNVIFLSNGTSTVKVFYLDGTKLEYKRQFTVFDGLKEVGLLNELEVIGTELWANVWMSDFIARIDLHTGKVNSWVDVREILHKSSIPNGHTVDVLNGIAYDEHSSSIYITGKHWPKLFSIQLTDRLVAQNITEVTNAFFLDRDQVEYVHKHILV
ncbi:Glutaminyl-peptide cyclotransferase [Gracilariopsis chorda]|uniref:Glutaminyl-peptide cyclotransferase n=1 Tax=Gracilariopsis chorda TaxID=448386 RepID=A0A2V3IL79_9FLOR|nr:Glutaminyl-peptide cyclotransferase [Gracilariopsis chorda]|eukprot:PXF42809.1 Glutaminyl-peptide cyclotransferase [Gracilariopsis chorda]